MDVVSSPTGIHDDGMRSSKGQPAGNKIDEHGETEPVDGSRRQIVGSIRVPFSFASNVLYRY